MFERLGEGGHPESLFMFSGVLVVINFATGSVVIVVLNWVGGFSFVVKYVVDKRTEARTAVDGIVIRGDIVTEALKQDYDLFRYPDSVFDGGYPTCR